MTTLRYIDESGFVREIRVRNVHTYLTNLAKHKTHNEIIKMNIHSIITTTTEKAYPLFN